MSGKPPKGTEHVYAYYKSQLGTRGINGFPCFGEARFMTTKDFIKFKDIVDRANNAMKEALGEPVTKTKLKVKRKVQDATNTDG